jgi:hypothetical protein
VGRNNTCRASATELDPYVRMATRKSAKNPAATLLLRAKK